MTITEPSGTQLSRAFATEVVTPLLTGRLPGLRHATARLGSGSDVLGFDDAMSRDHDWGCRLTLLLDEQDAALAEPVRRLLAAELPETFAGQPVRFPVTWDPSGSHQVEVATVAGFAASRLGAHPVRDQDGWHVPTLGWLTATGQGVLEVTAGPVFADSTSELAPLREALRWYPADVERYVLAAAWNSVGDRLPLLGRTAERGQELQSRVLSAALAGDLMELAFLVHRQWAPYAKWREASFRTLPSAAALSGPLETLVSAAAWQDRERAAANAADLLLGVQRESGLPAPDAAAALFWNRPYRTIDEQVTTLLMADVTDEALRRLPVGVGGVGQWIDCVPLLSKPENRAAAAAAYEAWLAQGTERDLCAEIA